MHPQARTYTVRRMPTRKDHKAACRMAPGAGRELVTTPVTEAESLDQLFERSLPSFGGAYLRRVWTLLDEARRQGPADDAARSPGR